MSTWIIRFFKNLILLIITGAIMICLFHCVFLIAFVPSGSMEDTIREGDFVLGIRHMTSYRRGDVVIFKDDDNSLFIKRIIGMPGDRVELTKEGLHLNGRIIREEYLKEKAKCKTETIFHVPLDHVLLLGDNRNHSKDARDWDQPYRKSEDILARAYITITIFPFSIRRI